MKNNIILSWMNIADEGTTAHLKVILQNCSKVVDINPQAAAQIINTCFERWGLPQNIKIDNGYPFVSPKYPDMPSLAKLWWIGLGINVIQNAPRCPQQNGAVECLQGIMHSWSNPGAYETQQELQQRLDQESDFQRNHYRMPSKQMKTRIECHPELETNTRVYNPGHFDMNRVYTFLQQQVWKRQISDAGHVRFFGQKVYIGTKFARQEILLTFDPLERQWLLRNPTGALMKSSSLGVPQEKQIKDFALMSKNSATT